MQALGQFFQVVLGNFRNTEGRQVRVAQLQHAGPQVELTAVGSDVPQVLKRQQEAACCRASHVSFARDVAQGHAWARVRESADHGESSLEGLNELPGALVRLTHAGMLGESTHGVQMIGMRTTNW